MRDPHNTRPRLIVASNNPHKVHEFAAILGKRFEIVSCGMREWMVDIEENGSTFVENALIKAQYVMDASGCAAIADDSGLEVDALGGAPGIYSARYCGRHGDDEANNDRLLHNLLGVPAPAHSPLCGGHCAGAAGKDAGRAARRMRGRNPHRAQGKRRIWL